MTQPEQYTVPAFAEADDLLRALYPELVGSKENLPGVAPPPIDSVAEELDELELGDYHGGAQYYTPWESPDGTFPVRPGSIPSVPSLSGFTYSTESSRDLATSAWSSIAPYMSNSFPPPDVAATGFDLECNSINPELMPGHVMDMSMFPVSFGPLPPSPPASPNVNVVNAMHDNGFYEPSLGISPDSLSATIVTMPESPPPDYPTTGNHQVCPASATHAREGPIRVKMFTCPHCDHRT